LCGSCGRPVRSFYDRRIHRVRDQASGGTRIYLEFEYRRVDCRRCHVVRQETLAWLAESGRFTKRFERMVGKDCRAMTIKEVAERHRLSWDQVRRMDVAYMRELWSKHLPSLRLRAIGVDEISIRKGHSYAIVVADLDQKRPIWMSVELGRAEEDMDRFFDDMGRQRCRSLRLSVMDMWPAFRNSLARHAPKARVVFDKFHVMRHLSDALDDVRRREYWRVAKKDRRFIKGQRYTLLSHKANLDLKGRRSLDLLLKANKRISKAYLLKESFGQLWDYQNPTWAKKFFENWKAQLKWSRMTAYLKFVKMVERHWEGIISYCHPDNKVSLGFMEGLNNKIRVIQRRSFGIRDMEYLRLKVLTSFIEDR
jgi:transposase